MLVHFSQKFLDAAKAKGLGDLPTSLRRQLERHDLTGGRIPGFRVRCQGRLQVKRLDPHRIIAGVTEVPGSDGPVPVVCFLDLLPHDGDYERLDSPEIVDRYQRMLC